MQASVHPHPLFFWVVDFPCNIWSFSRPPPEELVLGDVSPGGEQQRHVVPLHLRGHGIEDGISTGSSGSMDVHGLEMVVIGDHTSRYVELGYCQINWGMNDNGSSSSTSLGPVSRSCRKWGCSQRFFYIDLHGARQKNMCEISTKQTKNDKKASPRALGPERHFTPSPEFLGPPLLCTKLIEITSPTRKFFLDLARPGFWIWGATM